jgi:putative ABC transport system permease protein
MRSYFKLALKVLTRRKFFTFISLFGIALTLVVLVVATAMLDDDFTPHAPESRFDRVLMVTRVVKRGPIGTETMNPGYGFLHDYVFNLSNIERASAFTEAAVTAIYRNGGRIDVHLKRTDANYFRILDFHFLEGRGFTDDEEQRGSLVAVITDKMRDKLFDGAQAVGRGFELDGRHFRVVGVVPAVSASRIASYGEIWTPVTTLQSSSWRHDLMGGDFVGLVLARDRADIPRLKREFDARVKAIPIEDPKSFNETDSALDTPFESVAREIVGGPGITRFRDHAPLVLRLIITILALLFMTLPSLNLVTLSLSRILERAPEIGVRKAFGAGRAALIGQLVLENVVLTLIGGACAFVLSVLALEWINRSGVIDNAQYALNWRVFLWGIFIASAFGILSGFYPAWKMSRLHPVTALRGGAQ